MGMIFAEHETLAQINEKARIRGLTYGQYVLARYTGKFMEDAFEQLELKHEHRESWCKKTKRPSAKYY